MTEVAGWPIWTSGGARSRVGKAGWRDGVEHRPTLLVPQKGCEGSGRTGGWACIQHSGSRRIWPKNPDHGARPCEREALSTEDGGVPMGVWACAPQCPSIWLNSVHRPGLDGGETGVGAREGGDRGGGSGSGGGRRDEIRGDRGSRSKI